MQPIRRGAAALLGGAFLGAAGLLYAREIEPRWLEVRRLSLVLPRLAPEFDGYRIVQLGDIHLDDWAKPRRLTRLTEKVNALRPDLISLTGDFLSYSAGGATPRSLTGALGRLRAPDGCLAVLGNHDYLADAEVVRRCLSEAGVRELANDVRILVQAVLRPLGGQHLHPEKVLGELLLARALGVLLVLLGERLERALEPRARAHARGRPTLRGRLRRVRERDGPRSSRRQLTW